MSHFYIKNAIILPRQTRDKHKEKLENKYVFPRRQQQRWWRRRWRWRQCAESVDTFEPDVVISGRAVVGCRCGATADQDAECRPGGGAQSRQQRCSSSSGGWCGGATGGAAAAAGGSRGGRRRCCWRRQRRRQISPPDHPGQGYPLALRRQAAVARAALRDGEKRGDHRDLECSSVCLSRACLGKPIGGLHNIWKLKQRAVCVTFRRSIWIRPR